jgi:hypothetical protein
MSKRFGEGSKTVESACGGPCSDGDRNEAQKPESCRQAELECRSCVQQTAANLAGICGNLELDAVRESFLKIYPDHACMPMARTFVRAYRSAANEAADELDEFSLLAATLA